jgi:phosphopantothenoylcysteine decarboxylase/phosphopantothenate--cysteine ligase
MRMVRGLKLGFDAIIVPAAISDYSVEKAKGKLDSENVPALKLKRAPKVIKAIRARFRGILVGFKAQIGLDDATLEKEARDMMISSGANLAVANNMSKVKDDSTEIIIVPNKGAACKFSGTKLEAADAILDEVVNLL